MRQYQQAKLLEYKEQGEYFLGQECAAIFDNIFAGNLEKDEALQLAFEDIVENGKVDDFSPSHRYIVQALYQRVCYACNQMAILKEKWTQIEDNNKRSMAFVHSKSEVDYVHELVLHVSVPMFEPIKEKLSSWKQYNPTTSSPLLSQ